jgi:hypothetical protein
MSQKALIIVVVIVLVVVGVVALQMSKSQPTDNNTNTNNNNTNTNNPPPPAGDNTSSSGTGPTLALTPTSKSATVNEEFTIDLMLDTMGTAIDGIDVFSIRFNPAILQVVDSNTTTAGVQIGAEALIPRTVSNKVDNAKGTIQLSQITDGGNSYTGKGKIATIRFKAKAKGSSDLTFDFTKGSTTDTNVSGGGGGVDRLNAVINSKITVQ